ncbi:ras GTPase-activating protein gap-2 [Pyrenophora tritici-repentis]|nr:ras GTPase-activating protein gap-2 [Pyrenophora tritici-repentis]
MDQQRRNRREVSASEAAQAAFGNERMRDDRKAQTIRTYNQHLAGARSAATPRGFVARASSDSEYRNAREPARPRTRTLEERSTRERSPSSVFGTGRHRIGSIASSQNNYQSLEESQHPSLTASPLSSPSGVPPESWVSPVPASDAKKLKALMRSTCGKMQGLLAFRRGESNPWGLSYCYINEEAGSLVYEPKNDTSYTRTLVPDLRGCHVKSAYDGEAYTAYIQVIMHNSKLEVHLRPPTQEEFDSWFAALLCWSPMRPKGIQNRMAKPQAPVMIERRLADSRRHSEVSLLKESPKKEAPIIKVGKMIYWDTSVTYSNTGTPKSSGNNSRPQAYRLQSHGSRRWRRVSCTLRENGELKLYSDTDVTLVSTIQLSQLSRCAVQRLDPSVLDNEFCIAIYPQYTAATNSALTILRPIFLSLESRVLYEVWIVLLRAFTVPQLYGPKSDTMSDDGPLSPSFGTQDMFRMEKSLFVRVIEAKLVPPVSPKVADSNGTTPIRPSSSATTSPGGYLVELLLDGETRARTMVKSEGNNPFWREEFEFLDLPALHTASLLLKKRPPSYTRTEKTVFDSALSSDSHVSEGGYAGISFDQTLGKTDIYLDDLGANQEMEKWWPLINMYGNSVGEVLVKVSSEECAILMARDYYPLSELLHRFSNGLTLQIAHMIPNELRKLSEYLLNIFQVSGAAGEWICALVEEEIDGTLKESPASRLRFSKRLGSSESNESNMGTFGSASDRELFVRDMNNNAKLEANLLFRGNTLLTKSLDLHMKRLGKEYLEETLSEKLKEINLKDPDCEVDPNKVTSQHELDRNWRRLINCTEEVWRAIYNSVTRCPQELRLIFRHIRACADDRYGDYLRTVQYSSVSGFLFLRFFVPAVLNPKLFGLLNDHPKVKARRTFTLIAKSLQGLANMSSFGTKEAWMEPMNAFLITHRQEFKKYLDDICSISTTSQPAPPIPPSYSTPIAILHRLPPTFKEGFPSLPYLIDHSRNFAMLVNLWLDNTQKSAPDIQATDGDLLRFHNICLSLNERTKDCLNRAEPAERPSSSLSVKWEELVEQLQGAQIDTSRGAATRNNRCPIQEEDMEDTPLSPTNNGEEYSSSSTSTPITMQPPPRARHQQNSSISVSQSSLKSNNSGNISYTNPFAKKQWSGHYGPSSNDDGIHMAPAPSYPQALSSTLTTTISTSTSTQSFNYSNPNSHINTQGISAVSTNSLVGRPPRSAGGQSMEGSDSGSIVEEEYTTALPAFSEKAIKEKKERGFRGVLPFQRKSKRKDKDKDKEKEKESRKEKEREKERDKENRKDKGKDKDRDDGNGERGGSALESRTDMGVGMMSLRGKGVARTDERERDEEF